MRPVPQRGLVAQKGGGLYYKRKVFLQSRSVQNLYVADMAIAERNCLLRRDVDLKCGTPRPGILPRIRQPNFYYEPVR
jgi:hypothetical protein